MCGCWAQTLFFSLAVLFFLLAGGVVNPLLHKVRPRTSDLMDRAKVSLSVRNPFISSHSG